MIDRRPRKLAHLQNQRRHQGPTVLSHTKTPESTYENHGTDVQKPPEYQSQVPQTPWEFRQIYTLTPLDELSPWLTTSMSRLH